VTQNDLLNAAGIIVGSYTSYGIVAGGTKEFFDKTVKIHRKLQGKVGGAFASSGELGGGNEATVLSILQMLLVHGMIIPGDSNAPHFGAIAIRKPDEQNLKACRELGKRVADLAKALGL
jgi:NAD(P)H dehydrogenase (quinone)